MDVHLVGVRGLLSFSSKLTVRLMMFPFQGPNCEDFFSKDLGIVLAIYVHDCCILTKKGFLGSNVGAP